MTLFERFLGIFASGRQRPCALPSLFVAGLLLQSAPAADAQSRPSALATLGGIGCGAVSITSGGLFTHATTNNNWLRPIDELRGCFASLWTSAGGAARALVLARHSPYGLPTADSVRLTPRFPTALLDYPDSRLPVTVTLRAFSPLIPQDLKSSAVPGALFVFTIHNVSRAPAAAAIAFSWDNYLGVGGDRTALSDRTGNTAAALPPSPGEFGVKLACPARQPVDPGDRSY